MYNSVWFKSKTSFFCAFFYSMAQRFEAFSSRGILKWINIYSSRPTIREKATNKCRKLKGRTVNPRLTSAEDAVEHLLQLSDRDRLVLETQRGFKST